MICLKYHGLDTHPQLYTVEWFNPETGFNIIEVFEGKFAYLQAVMFCDANNVNGRIFYPIKGVVQKVIDGQPIKRGRKRKRFFLILIKVLKIKYHRHQKPWNKSNNF